MVEKIPCDITLRQFQDLYLIQNKPCIFSKVFTDDWRSRREWVKNGKPNLEYLEDKFGDSSIHAADCGKKQFNSHEKVEMTLREFLEYWKTFTDDDQRLLYLKDWHFQREFPQYRAYEVPKYFQSDWLNEWYDQSKDHMDDYRFVYMGPKGTWTAFHADVLRSYSWSANICGKKRWLLYPPGEEENLKDMLGNLPFDVMSKELEDKKKHPNFFKAAKPIELIQEEGEIVFIPSGWYHQVHNLEDTISINHNWTNAYGIDFVLRHLQEELLLVEKEIAEFRDTEGWYQQCQLLLKCTAGMDYQQFLTMLVDLMRPRFEVYKLCTTESMSKGRDVSSGAAKDGETTDAVDCVLQTIKRFDITCVPKEHLKFGAYGACNGLQDCALLDEKIKELKFHLLKLIEVYRRLLPSCQSRTQFENLNEHNETVEEIEEFLRIDKGS